MFSKIIVHKVGNKINQENLFLAEEELELGEEMQEILENYFLSAFKTEEQFQFHSDSLLVHNPVYSAVSEIFETKDNFLFESKNIAQHLFDCANNPRIMGGELFIVYFEGEETEEGDKIDAIGIFKTERKNPFLKIQPQNQSFNLEQDFGISLSKLDKGCIIYNHSKETGYAVSIVDNNKKGDEYWFDEFLKVTQRNDDYFNTQETLSVYKDFVVNQLPEEFEVSRADQADFLNKSINFFKERDEFNYDDFTQEVLEDEHIIESFSNYKSDFESDCQISIAEDFPINNSAVKKNQRYFKSVIKLDKNFHIYVHGDRQMIEQGQNEKGKYYRLYFEQEK
ncbi:MAG: hypothetical protein CSA38_04585 [Flavobacteriales bacterium]|nr:MAG: hypothetical protein CSA38_04585 [Flavobacteriales bacterium]